MLSKGRDAPGKTVWTLSSCRRVGFSLESILPRDRLHGIARFS